MIIPFLFSLWACYMGPIWATRIWANPYGTHAEPGCTPCMAPIWVAHMGPIQACLLGATDLSAVCNCGIS